MNAHLMFFFLFYSENIHNMAKTYAESVKLPNLVSVPHPSTKFLPKSGLNVEGRNSTAREASFMSDSRQFDRRSFISSLLGGILCQKLNFNFIHKVYFLFS